MLSPYIERNFEVVPSFAIFILEILPCPHIPLYHTAPSQKNKTCVANSTLTKVLFCTSVSSIYKLGGNADENLAGTSICNLFLCDFLFLSVCELAFWPDTIEHVDEATYVHCGIFFQNKLVSLTPATWCDKPFTSTINLPCSFLKDSPCTVDISIYSINLGICFITTIIPIEAL